MALILMIVGTGLELVLLGHYESMQQLIPIISVGLILVLVILLAFSPTKPLKNIFKITLLIALLSGFYGVFLHLQSNYEFEIEMTPTATKWDLFLESLSGALPALAPLSMLVLALIGYSYLILINQKQ